MNWGNKLFVTFLVFGAGMTFLVYRSIHTNYEMVEKDYYKNELSYQQVIDGTNRANSLTTTVNLEQTENGILLHLPEEMKNKTITGEVWFYCAYNEKKDKKFELNLSTEGIQLFGKKLLNPGNYSVKITWNCDGKAYYTEKSLAIK
jgi:FixH